jgi:hypothetical protein
MRGTLGLRAVAALALAGCSSSSGNPVDVGSPEASTPVDINNFIGGSWSGTETTTGTCAGATPGTTYEPIGLAFVVQGSGISYTSTLTTGCTFDFSVSGDTATLSNGPVTCGTAGADGATAEVTYSTYTLTTTDGQNLTGAFTVTGKSGGTNCTSTGTITAMR